MSAIAHEYTRKLPLPSSPFVDSPHELGAERPGYVCCHPVRVSRPGTGTPGRSDSRPIPMNFHATRDMATGASYRYSAVVYCEGLFGDRFVREPALRDPEAILARRAHATGFGLRAGHLKRQCEHGGQPKPTHSVHVEHATYR